IDPNPAVITYRRVETVDDLNGGNVRPNRLTVNPPALAADNITGQNRPPVNGAATDPGRSENGTVATPNFANKGAVTVNALGGNDTVQLGDVAGNLGPAPGLSLLTVNAGEGGDTVTVGATPGAVPVVVDGGPGDDAIGVGVTDLGSVAGAV